MENQMKKESISIYDNYKLDSEIKNTEEKYYYFVSDKYGMMYYATNLKDHEANIAAIKKSEADENQ